MQKELAQLDALQQAFDADRRSVKDAKALETLRVKYLGRKGSLTSFYKLIQEVSPEQRPILGQKINQVKNHVQHGLDELKERFDSSGDARLRVDVTLPGNQPFFGKPHILLQTLDEVQSIFRGMGFSIETGPEVESDYYNFEALNIPADHPSRDMQDTFYLTDNRVLRTHTSPVQIRTMEKQRPPVRIIAPGRCFRKDTPDATHSPVFTQVEGLVVDEGVSLADLKGVLQAFTQIFFGPKTKIRFRPSFFPFTEPSAEVDIWWETGNGRGTWLEILGCGMVDPAVFGFVNYDAERYSGYAFGMGIERLVLLKYQIDDIRMLTENDVRFLAQF